MTDEQRISAGVAQLVAEFARVVRRIDHLRLVDQAAVRRQIEWIKRNRPARWDADLKPAMDAAWARTDPASQQPGLGL